MSPTDQLTTREWVEPEEIVSIDLTVNELPLPVKAPARRTLADALRECGLTGTQLGCEQGSCGACTVLLDDQPVRSCLTLAVQAEGSRVETVEGLASGEERHVLQQAFHEHGALQCGFCTPGFLMLAAGLLRTEPTASPERIREVLSSNLCRCTGGVPILKAVLAAQQQLAADEEAR